MIQCNQPRNMEKDHEKHQVKYKVIGLSVTKCQQMLDRNTTLFFLN